jgi:hypothetical protein
MLEADIVSEIQRQFGKDSSKAVKILEKAILRKDISETPRIARCIVFLSKGSIKKLRENIEINKIDWRDIIGSAEKDRTDLNSSDYLKNFNNPFPQSETAD